MDGYTDERTVQLLVSLLKQHGVRRAVISPGTTNVSLVASLQNDPFFELASSADERSAAYMACGMAAECGEPVMISCTGATASRNYIPALTEAYYRDLPILAVTASQHLSHAGQMFPQMLDRTVQLGDMVRKSVQVPAIHTAEDQYGAEVAINDALLSLRRCGGGPAHINYVTELSGAFDVRSLPVARCIRRYTADDALPAIPDGRVAVFVGAHAPFEGREVAAIDSFCDVNDAVVLCDQTSNYRGHHRMLANLLSWQDAYRSPLLDIDTMIHIGAISGSYMKVRPKRVWRVHPRGDVQDPFKKLDSVFAMDEAGFFAAYSESASQVRNGYCRALRAEIDSVRAGLPELPFSNVWCAQQTAPLLPEGSALHLGILNSLRCWNLFETPESVTCFCNTGGFGIDGGVSALLGASLANPGKLYFGVVGDLAFFYDMNSLGNRHVGPNIRLMVVNNGRGTEFRNYWHPAAAFGDAADAFMAAAGHYGDKSLDLLRHYATDLGFEYLSASSKGEFLERLGRFVDPAIREQSVLLEVFTDTALESEALRMAHGVKSSPAGAAKTKVKSLIGAKGMRAVRKLVRGK